jgi:hypothetical protein
LKRLEQLSGSEAFNHLRGRDVSQALTLRVDCDRARLEEDRNDVRSSASERTLRPHDEGSNNGTAIIAKTMMM